jgi:ferritin-like metal-binding protein YciE
MAKAPKQLDDLKKIVSTLPKMAKAATSPDLKKAFEKHKTETEGHVKRLEEVFGLIDAKPQAKTCDAIMGIVKEGEGLIDEYKGSPALDAALLSVAQAVEHYEISRYGSLKCWAEELGIEGAAEILDATLEEEKRTDKALTELAVSVVNLQAEAA